MRTRLLISAVLLLAGTHFSALLADPATTSESITIQGKGAGTTRTLTLKDGWTAQITADAPIKVSAVGADGSPTVLVSFPAATPPPPSYTGTSLPVAKGGTYTLSVETTGAWQISLVETGFDKNLAIGGATVPPPATTPGTTPPVTPVAPGIAPVTMSTEPVTVIGNYHRTSDPGDSHPEDTPTFTVTGRCRIAWKTERGVKITLVSSAGDEEVISDDTSANHRPRVPDFIADRIVAGPGSTPSSSEGKDMEPRWYSSSHMPNRTGTFHLRVEGQGAWTISVIQFNHMGGQPFISTNSSSTNSVSGTPPAPVPPAPTVKLTDDQARAVVLIKGDKGEGTGFLVKTPQGPAIVTNIHVIADNPNLKITTNTGALITVLSEKGASDRDLALLAIKDYGYSYLQFSGDISKDVSVGDQVVTPGNSEGGEVMLNTGGKLLGVGPVRVEFDNPIYHGNSGGPVFHTKSGKVIGVVTMAEKVRNSDDLDRASASNSNSAISGGMRYFGLRIDTVTSWITIDPRRFEIEGTFLREFHDQSRRLDAYLNHDKGDANAAHNLYSSDEKIMRAENSYTSHINGADAAQRIDSTRNFVADLQSIAGTDMDQIAVRENFYGFDQDRAADELSYRKALIEELTKIGSDIQRISSLPRTNNYNNSDSQ